MKIAFLAGYNVIHTVRWVNSLAEHGHEVHLLSLHRGQEKLHPKVKKVVFPFPPPYGYYLNVPFLRYYLSRVKPDVLNAHYASGYGTLGRLSCYQPYVLSVWGSDVYDFPQYSARNRNLVVKNLKSADVVCSTSHAMAKFTRGLCPDLEDISITPFGVDIDTFSPPIHPPKSDYITIGTVKKLEKKYGIDVLLRSFAVMREKVALQSQALADQLRLLIVGGGSEEENLIKMAKDLKISDVTCFSGVVPYNKVPSMLNQMDVYVALSRLDSESFGVAIIEASACGIPVVVSDVDGPCEVVNNHETGIIVPREDVSISAAALQSLVEGSALRLRLGQAGRAHVVENYDWDKSVLILDDIYQKAARLTT